MVQVGVVTARDGIEAREKLSRARGMLASTEQSPPAATSVLESVLEYLDEVMRMLGEHQPEGRLNDGQGR